MSGFTVREYHRSDKAALAGLWCKVFEDSESLVKSFLELLPKMGTGFVAEVEGRIAGMAFALRGIDIVEGKKLLPCGYIYAVATEEEFRGMGIGSALSKAAAETLKNLNAVIISTLPAESSLYKWYGEMLGVKPVLYRKAVEFKAEASVPCQKVSASDYLIAREDVLHGQSYLSVSLHVAEFQRLLCEEYGGGMYMGSGFMGFAYRDEGRAIIKELICKEENRLSAASAIAAEMGCTHGVFYENSPHGEPYIAATGADICTTCIWNFSFD